MNSWGRFLHGSSWFDPSLAEEGSGVCAPTGTSGLGKGRAGDLCKEGSRLRCWLRGWGAGVGCLTVLVVWGSHPRGSRGGWCSLGERSPSELTQ